MSTETLQQLHAARAEAADANMKLRQARYQHAVAIANYKAGDIVRVSHFKQHTRYKVEYVQFFTDDMVKYVLRGIKADGTLSSKLSSGVPESMLQDVPNE